MSVNLKRRAFYNLGLSRWVKWLYFIIIFLNIELSNLICLLVVSISIDWFTKDGTDRYTLQMCILHYADTGTTTVYVCEDYDTITKCQSVDCIQRDPCSVAISHHYETIGCRVTFEHVSLGSRRNVYWVYFCQCRSIIRLLYILWRSLCVNRDGYRLFFQVDGLMFY